MCRALQCCNLSVDIVAAGQHFDKNFRTVFGVAEQLFANLFGEFARGSNDQSLDLGATGVDFCQHGQTKCRRFSGACLRLGDEIGILGEQKRNGLFLDRSGSDNPQFGEALAKVRGNPQFGKRVQNTANVLVKRNTSAPIGQ